MTVHGVRLEQTGPPIDPGARVVLEWIAPPEGVWKVVGLRVTEQASAFDLVEAVAHQASLIEAPVPCAIFVPYVEPWELEALSPTMPSDVDPLRIALPAVAVRLSEHALVVGSRLRLKVENKHRDTALHFRATLFVRATA
jgi:hypothetical protein